MSNNMEFVRMTEQAEMLHRLIDDCSRILDHTSDVSTQGNFARDASDRASMLTEQARELMIGKKPIQQILIGIPLAGGWLGAKAVDVYRNSKAKSAARKAILDAYEQLATMQNRLIAEQLRLYQMLVAVMEDTRLTEAEQQEQREALKKRQEELSNLLDRFNQLEKRT